MANFYVIKMSGYTSTECWEPLRGVLSPSLLELKYLNYLDLSYNDFQGIPIPNFIGSLNNLTYLNLSYASFAGMIPPHLGNLSNLLYLDLSVNCPPVLTSNLNWLSGLSSLKYLSLNGENLSEATTNWLQTVNLPPSLLEGSCPFVNLIISLKIFPLSTLRHFQYLISLLMSFLLQFLNGCSISLLSQFSNLAIVFSQAPSLRLQRVTYANCRLWLYQIII